MSGKYPGGFVQVGAPAGYSVALDGTGDFLTVPYNVNLSLDTGDFCVEAWVYKTAASGNDWKLINGSASPFMFIGDGGTSSSRGLGWGNATAGWTFISGVLTPVNEWAHICYTRLSGVGRIFLNGYMRAYTASNTTNLGLASATMYIGSDNTSIYLLQGFMSNLRITKGAVPTVYQTSATTPSATTQIFVPPTQLFPIGDTQLLTCQSPTIIDNSTNNFTITANGDAKVSTFTPFVGYAAGAAGFNPALGAAAPGIWTLEEATYYQGNRLWPIYDPTFNQTTLMLHGNQPPDVTDTNNSVFKDSSTNNFTLTRNGNTTQGTFSPFSQTGWSNFFNGSTDYLSYTTGGSSDFNLSTGNWTLEAWVYRAVAGAAHEILLLAPSVGSNAGLSFYFDSSNRLVIDNGVTGTTPVGSVLANTWTHVAAVRTSGNTQLYINGVATGAVITQAPSVAQFLYVGRAGTAVNYMNGYLSNVRIVKGQALASGSFTPPTSPLTTTTVGWTGANAATTLIGSVSLLTCQSNRFVNNSSNGLLLTANGTPSVQAFEPFAPDIPYSASVVGGSGYFDRSTDYLDVSSNSNLTIGTSDFTIAFWTYFNVIDATSQVIFEGRPSSVADNVTPQILYSAPSSAIVYQTNGSIVITGTASVTTAGQWYYIVVSRLSGTTRLFVNGSQQGSNYTDGNNYVAFAADRPRIGARGSSAGASLGFSGYISGLQVLVGTGSSSSTVPTAPPTPTKLTNNGTQSGTLTFVVGSDAPNTLYYVCQYHSGMAGVINIVNSGTSEKVYAVTANGSSNYVINGASNPTLTLVRGETYTFNVNATGHPFWITTASGAYSAGNVYLGTSLLLNYTNAGIIDNTAKNVLETVGGVSVSTVLSKWGGSSMLFNGTTGYLVSQDSVEQNFSFGTGNFTVEFWINTASLSAEQAVFDTQTLGGAASRTASFVLVVTTSGTFRIYTNSAYSSATSNSITINTWNHIAMVRSGSTINIYVNGVSGVSITNSTNFSTSSCVIGRYADSATSFLNGYLDDLRVTKGVARYTANFTLPTSQLQSQ